MSTTSQVPSSSKSAGTSVLFVAFVSQMYSSMFDHPSPSTSSRSDASKISGMVLLLASYLKRGSRGHGSLRSATPSLSSSGSALSPKPSASESNHSRGSYGKASITSV